MFNLFVAKVRVANNPETREAGDTTVTKFVGSVEVGGTDDKGYARTELVKFEAWNGLGVSVPLRGGDDERAPAETSSWQRPISKNRRKLQKI